MFQSNKNTKLVTALGAAVLALALLVPSALAKTPAPGYSQFAGCPSPEEVAHVEACFRSEVTSGHFQMGSKDVPITNPIVVSGGITEGDFKFVYNSKGGLLPAKQQVPGGIVGLTGLDWLVNVLNAEGLKLYAVTELAGTPSNPLSDPFSLPIKVHLINPVLGNNCYVGSNSSPIQLQLTQHTTSPPPPNKPITGKEPAFEFDFETLNILLNDGTLVDNSFAAPKSNGCELNVGLIHIGIDTLVSGISGLPAAAGSNATVQNFDAEVGNPALVYP